MTALALHTIHFHGALRKRYGASFELAVRSPAEAIRALMAQLPGLEDLLRAGVWKIRRGSLAKGRGRFLDRQDLAGNLNGEMHILAAPRGAGGKGGGTAKLIIGVVLIAVAVIVTGGGAAPIAGAMSSIGVSAGAVGMFGLSLALTGITTLISANAKAKNSGAQDTNASFLISGQVNSADQGVPVPLLLGNIRHGSVVISGGVDTVDAPLDDASTSV